MEIAKIKVSGATASAERLSKITAGMVGVTVRMQYADIWDGLHKTVVFRAGTVTKDVITDDEVVTVPKEVAAAKDVYLQVGVYGVDAEGNLVIPTIWAGLGTVRDGADPSGDAETDASLPAWVKIMTDAETAVAVAQSVRDDADRGAFDGKPGKPGNHGITPTIGENGNWYLGDTDTGIPSRGESGKDGVPGKDGASVTVANVTESTQDGGSNVVTFSDGKTLTVKNGATGAAGAAGPQGAKGDTGPQGPQGEKGEKGDTGNAATLSSAVATYQVSDSGSIIPSGAWVDSVPVVAQGKYLWTKTETQFNTGDPIVSYSVSRMGMDGSGSVSAVAGVSPDETGNVTLTAADVGALPSSGGGMTGAINMNGQPISGLNDPTEDTQAARKGYVDASKAEAISHANAAIRKAAPRNLLDNSDFRNPVNQRGFVSGTVGSGSYTIDRWRLQYETYLHLHPGYVGVSGKWDIMQPVGCKMFAGKTYTFAVDAKSEAATGNAYIGFGLVGGNKREIRPAINDTGWTKCISTWTAEKDYEPGEIQLSFGVNTGTELTTKIYYKNPVVYEGEYTEETLPEYQPKGYGAELAECQRYYIHDKSVLAVKERENIFFICQNVHMRDMGDDLPTVTMKKFTVSGVEEISIPDTDIFDIREISPGNYRLVLALLYSCNHHEVGELRMDISADL